MAWDELEANKSKKKRRWRDSAQPISTGKQVLEQMEDGSE